MAEVDLGKIVRERRKALKMSQRKLGELTHISNQHLAAIELNNANPSMDVLFLLAKTLGFSLDALLDADETFSRADRDKMERILRFRTPEQRAIILETMECLSDKLWPSK